MADMLDTVVYRPRCYQVGKIDTLQLYNPFASLDCTEGISDARRRTAIWPTKVNHRDRYEAPPIDK